MMIYLIRAPRNTRILVSTSHPFPTSMHVPLPTHSLHDNQRNLLQHKSDYPTLIPVAFLPLSKDETLIPDILKALLDVVPAAPTASSPCHTSLLSSPPARWALSLTPSPRCRTLSMLTWPPHAVWNVLPLSFVWLMPTHLSNFSMILISSKIFLLTLLGRSDALRVLNSSFGGTFYICNLEIIWIMSIPHIRLSPMKQGAGLCCPLYLQQLMQCMVYETTNMLCINKWWNEWRSW